MIAVWLVAVVLIVFGAVALIAGDVRLRAKRRDLALRHVRLERALEASRALAFAARESLVAVRDELAHSLQRIDEDIDAIAIFDVIDERLVCVFAAGPRYHRYEGLWYELCEGDIAVVAALAGACVAPANGVHGIHPGDRTALAVPLEIDRSARSVVYASSYRERAALPASDISALVDQAVPAYLLAREREEDRHRAIVDPMTGLLAKTAFAARLTEEMERSSRQPHPRIALLFVDLDHFKTWNDTYGHLSADHVLKRIARLLEEHRASELDLVARFGGDEFCLALLDADKSTAIDCAAAIAEAIALDDRAFLLPRGSTQDVTITASIGIAVYPVDAQSLDGLLAQADAAAYHAKHSGRDGVSFFDHRGELSAVPRRRRMAEVHYLGERAASGEVAP